MNALALSALLLAAPAYAETLYSVENDMLLRTEVDLGDGQVVSSSLVGHLNAPSAIGALTPEVDGVLYATGGNLNRWLIAIDAETGEAEVIGYLGVEIDTLAVNPRTGRLFGSGVSDWLFSIDADTAEIDAIGFIGSKEGPVQDLMWVDGAGLMARWDTDIGGVLGEIDVYTGDAVGEGGQIPLRPGSRMVFSRDDDVFYETSGVNVRAHRATSSDFRDFRVFAMR